MKTNFTQSVEKKFLTVALITGLLYGISSIAETNTAKKEAINTQSFKLAPSVGYTYFNIEGANAKEQLPNQVDLGDSTYKAKGGNSIGVLVQYSMSNPQLILETGLEYFETASKLAVDSGLLSYEYFNIRMSHLGIPLRAKYLFSDAIGSDSRYYVKGGLLPTALISSKSQFFTGEEIDTKSSMNTYGLFAQAGVGGDWATSFYNGRVGLDVMYNYGLTKVFKDLPGRASGLSLQASYIIEL